MLNEQRNFEIYNSTVDNLFNDMHPMSYATGFAENEVFYLGQMLKQKDRAEFAVVMDKEVEGHNKGNHWKIVKRSDATTPIIKSIWSFKRKRSPSGQITKHKARICAHGGMQR